MARIWIKHSDPDPYQIEKQDPDPYQSDKQDPDPDQKATLFLLLIGTAELARRRHNKTTNRTDMTGQQSQEALTDNL
jgi:hypothetical protein